MGVSSVLEPTRQSLTVSPDKNLWSSSVDVKNDFMFVPVLTALPSVTATGVQRCE